MLGHVAGSPIDLIVSVPVRQVHTAPFLPPVQTFTCTLQPCMLTACACLAPVLQCRAKLDSNAALAEFCSDLEAAVIETIEQGKMTKDLAICVHGTTKVTPDQYLNTEAFMEAISATFQQKRHAKSKM